MRRATLIAVPAAMLSFLVIAVTWAATTGPAAPTNVQQIGATETSVTIAWGPTQPGPFSNLGEPRKNTVLVGWGASKDSRSAVHYELTKDGGSPLTVSANQYLVTGLNRKTTFRVCVTAINVAGLRSPQSCVTFAKIA